MTAAKATTAPTRKPMPSLHGSELAAFHGSSSFRPMLEQIPSWVQARDALVALSKIKLPAAGTDHALDLARTVADDVRSGDKVTGASVLAEAAALAQQSVARDLAVTALTHARIELLQDLDDAARSQWARFYAALNDELTETLTGLRAIANPRAILTAEAAINADRVDDHRRFNDLITQYVSIRGRQDRLDREAGVTPRFAESRLLRTPETAWPEWRRYQLGGEWAVHPVTGEPPSHPLTAPWEQHGDAVDVLLWALEANAELWVPTPRQLNAEGERLTALVINGGPITPDARRREQRRVNVAMATD